MMIPRRRGTLADITAAIGIVIISAILLSDAAAQSEAPLPYKAEIANLAHQEPAVRIRALLDIASYGDKAEDGVPNIARILEDPEVEVRLTALRALGIIGPVAGTASLSMAALLDDPAFVMLSSTKNTLDYQSVAVAAAKALGGIGTPAGAAVPALIEALETEDEFLKAAIIEALGNIGSGSPLVTKVLFQQLRGGSALISLETKPAA